MFSSSFNTVNSESILYFDTVLPGLWHPLMIAFGHISLLLSLFSKYATEKWVNQRVSYHFKEEKKCRKYLLGIVNHHYTVMSIYCFRNKELKVAPKMYFYSFLSSPSGSPNGLSYVVNHTWPEKHRCFKDPLNPVRRMWKNIKIFICRQISTPLDNRINFWITATVH